VVLFLMTLALPFGKMICRGEDLATSNRNFLIFFGVYFVWSMIVMIVASQAYKKAESGEEQGNKDKILQARNCAIAHFVFILIYFLASVLVIHTTAFTPDIVSTRYARQDWFMYP